MINVLHLCVLFYFHFAWIKQHPRPRTAIPYVKTSYEPESVNSMYLMGSEAPATSKISNVFVGDNNIQNLTI
jgi:hypothetical protein